MHFHGISNAFQIIQGLETLELRIKKHSENALQLAKWLQEQPEVSWVNYPGLETSKYKVLAKKWTNITFQGGPKSYPLRFFCR